VVSAIFRRVPGRVEAENYGHEGPNKSYGVADSAKKAELYRTSEPVPVVAVGLEGSRQRGQAVQLRPKEWTAYTVNSLTSRDYAGSIRVKAATAPATVRLSVNGHVSELAVPSTDWAEIKAGSLRFNEGVNVVRLEVQAGTVCVDWLDFE
jgi:endoglucanase